MEVTNKGEVEPFDFKLGRPLIGRDKLKSCSGLLAIPNFLVRKLHTHIRYTHVTIKYEGHARLAAFRFVFIGGSG